MGGAFQWIGDRLMTLAGWLAGVLAGWLQGAFSVLRAFGDLEIAAVLSGAHAYLPSTASVLAGSYIPAINHYFPLSETLALLTTYGTLWSLVMGYRLVKSWIPTVAT